MNKGFFFNNVCIFYKLLINLEDVKLIWKMCDFICDVFIIIKLMYCMYVLYYMWFLLIKWNWKKSLLIWKDLDW